MNFFSFALSPYVARVYDAAAAAASPQSLIRQGFTSIVVVDIPPVALLAKVPDDSIRVHFVAENITLSAWTNIT